MIFFPFSLLFFFIPSQQLCPAPCYECPSPYYYNKGIQLKEFINFEIDCSIKSQFDILYTRDIFLSNKLCNDPLFPSKCTGDASNPMDDFWKVIKSIYDDQASRYQKQEIKIFLLGFFFLFFFSIFYLLTLYITFMM